MGRAIVRDPRVFLMDEPLSNLDARLRVQMRAEVARVQRDLGVTTIYVTHDQVEAMTMGDRVAVMRGGVLQQTGRAAVGLRPPREPVRGELHRQPADEPRPGDDSSSAATRSRCKIGEQEIVVPVRCRRRVGAGCAVRRPRGRSRHPPGASPRRDTATSTRATPRRRFARPRRSARSFSSTSTWTAEPVLTEEVREVAGDVDAAALERLESEALERRTVLIARLETQPAPSIDATIEVGVDTRRLHFFDLDSGTRDLRLDVRSHRR